MPSPDSEKDPEQPGFAVGSRSVAMKGIPCFFVCLLDQILSYGPISTEAKRGAEKRGMMRKRLLDKSSPFLVIIIRLQLFTLNFEL